MKNNAEPTPILLACIRHRQKCNQMSNKLLTVNHISSCVFIIIKWVIQTKCDKIDPCIFTFEHNNLCRCSDAAAATTQNELLLRMGRNQPYSPHETLWLKSNIDLREFKQWIHVMFIFGLHWLLGYNLVCASVTFSFTITFTL